MKNNFNVLLTGFLLVSSFKAQASNLTCEGVFTVAEKGVGKEVRFEDVLQKTWVKDVQELIKGGVRILLGRDAQGKVNSIQLSHQGNIKTKESGIKFPEVVEAVLKKGEQAKDLSVTIDQHLKLEGKGEYQGLEISRNTIEGVDRINLRVDQYIETIADGQSYASVMLITPELPAGFKITIGGEIKKIAPTGKYFKQKCK